MDDKVWRPSRPHWTDSDGVIWKRQRRWLSERDARRLVMRATAAVAVERAAAHELSWVPLEERAAYWEIRVAGHVVGRGQSVPANQDGVTYHVSTWKTDAGDGLVLLSEMC